METSLKDRLLEYFEFFSLKFSGGTCKVKTEVDKFLVLLSKQQDSDGIPIRVLLLCPQSCENPYSKGWVIRISRRAGGFAGSFLHRPKVKILVDKQNPNGYNQNNRYETYVL